MRTVRMLRAGHLAVLPRPRLRGNGNCTMSETPTRYQTLTKVYELNQKRLVENVGFAKRIMRCFVASHAWPDSLCDFAEIVASPDERMLNDRNRFVVSSGGEVRCELQLQIALPSSVRSVPIRIPMFVRTDGEKQWASLLSSNIGNDVTSDLSDEELGERLATLLAGFLSDEVAKRF